MKVHSVNFDNVIKSRFVTAETDYKFALEQLVPLINRLDIQRNVQDAKFYQRLEKDLITGCIMPPITLAFIDKEAIKEVSSKSIESYINSNITEGFILDGIQRLNTLQRTYKRHDGELKLDRKIYLNILICYSMDNLLYRMITLNNGQKPMTAKHQIEILTANVFEFEDSPIPILTEKTIKHQKIKIAFSKADFIKGYLAFLSDSTNIENQKIIEDKLDQLIADKILTSDVTENQFQFNEIVSFINHLITNKHVYHWFKNVNNLIGFCVGIKRSFLSMNFVNPDKFERAINLFEDAFSNFDFSKIKVGRMRRDLVNHFIARFNELHNLEVLELVDVLSQLD